LGKVVVVGGGIAGLAAAQELVRRGCEVSVLEQAAQAGGRARSHAEKDVRYEPGGHVVTARDRHFLDLVDAAGLASTHLPVRPIRLAQAGVGGLAPIDPASRVGVARIPGVGRLAGLRLMRLGRLLDRYSAGLDPDAPERAEAQDDRSAGDFARLYFGKRVLRGWLAPWLADVATADPEEASRVLSLLLLATQRHAPHGTLRGDLGDVGVRLAERLDVRLSCPVQAIEARARGLEVHHAAGTCEADGVVLALPARAALELARPLLTRAETEVLDTARTTPMLSVAFGLDEPLVRLTTRLRVPGPLSYPFHAVLIERGVPKGRVPEGKGLGILLARDDGREESDEALLSRFQAGLDRLFPGAVSRILFGRVHRHPAALPRFDVGRYRALARLRRVEAEERARGRRLVLAGDHLAAPSLEGAASSGRRAALALARDLSSGSQW
jgi:oxygen-dependent protoporphyrinogen oxidase